PRPRRRRETTPPPQAPPAPAPGACRAARPGTAASARRGRPATATDSPGRRRRAHPAANAWGNPFLRRTLARRASEGSMLLPPRLRVGLTSRRLAHVAILVLLARAARAGVVAADLLAAVADRLGDLHLAGRGVGALVRLGLHPGRRFLR